MLCKTPDTGRRVGNRWRAPSVQTAITKTGDFAAQGLQNLRFFTSFNSFC